MTFYFAFEAFMLGFDVPEPCRLGGGEPVAVGRHDAPECPFAGVETLKISTADRLLGLFAFGRRALIEGLSTPMHVTCGAFRLSDSLLHAAELDAPLAKGSLGFGDCRSGACLLCLKVGDASRVLGWSELGLACGARRFRVGGRDVAAQARELGFGVSKLRHPVLDEHARGPSLGDELLFFEISNGKVGFKRRNIRTVAFGRVRERGGLRRELTQHVVNWPHDDGEGLVGRMARVNGFE